MATDIYIYGGSDADDELYRDDLEDALRGLLGQAGRLTGGGSGVSVAGYNVDLSMSAGEDIDSWVSKLVGLLRELGAGPSTYFEVFPAGYKAGMAWRRVDLGGGDRLLTKRER